MESFRTIESKRHEPNKDNTVVSSPQGILRHLHQIPDVANIALSFRNRPFASRTLKALLEEVATPIPIVNGEDTLDGVAESQLSKERPAWKIELTQSRLSA